MKLLIGGLDKNGFLLPTDLGEQNRTPKMIHCQLAGPHGPVIVTAQASPVLLPRQTVILASSNRRRQLVPMSYIIHVELSQVETLCSN